MYASQLLRILETFPKNVNNEIYDFDTVEPKEAMKESPRRYTNPFLSDEENEKINLWNNQELERLNIRDDLTNNYEEDKLRTSLAPSEFSEKETEVYTDKNVMECELPEFLVCYKDGAFHVKDICVDDGIPLGENILFNKNNNEIRKSERLHVSSMEDYYMESNLSSGTNGKIGTYLPVLEPIGDNCNEVIERKSDAYSRTQQVDADLSVTVPISDHRNMEIPVQDLQISVADNDCEDSASKECGTKEEVFDSVIPNELKNVSKDDADNEDENSKCAPDKLKSFSESNTVSKAAENYGLDINSSDKLLDDASTEEVISNSVLSLQQDQSLPSLESLLESNDNQQSYQSPVEEILKRSIVQTTNISNESSGEPGTSSGAHKVENPEHVQEPYMEPLGTPKDHDMGSNNVAMRNPMHRGGEGESSFSVAGPVSGLITYSGPIAFSGSISLRSDSSTTSTRSFAFPILQNEWNSSPVRMAKADRRRLQKHRGWRHGLLCCRF